MHLQSAETRGAPVQCRAAKPYRMSQISQTCCPDSCSLLSLTGSLFPRAVLAENSRESQATRFSGVTAPQNNAATSSSHSETATVCLTAQQTTISVQIL